MIATNNSRTEVAAQGHSKAAMFDLALETTVFNSSIGFPRCPNAVEYGDSNPPTGAESSIRKKLHFPHRLFRMLEEIRQCRPYLSHIVSWHEDCDTAFVINNLEAFLVDVMPVYFGSQSKFASFQRQLNNYDFQRVQDRRQNGSVIYWHKNFSRTYPHKIQEVVLKKCKTNQLQHLSSPPSSPQLSSVVMQLLLSVSNSVRSDNELPPTNQEVNFHDAIAVGDHVLDEAVVQLLFDATVVPGSVQSYYSDYCPSQPEVDTTLSIPPTDQFDWDPDAESMICCD